MALMLVSHDLAVIAGHCERVIVMYAGMIDGERPGRGRSRGPENPYTRALLEARPQPGAPRGVRLKTIAGSPPVHHEIGSGLPVRRPLRTHDRHLPHAPPAGGSLRRGPPFALPPREGDGRSSDGDRRMSEPPLLEVVDLVKTYRLPRTSPFSRQGRRPALAGVSFSVVAGHSFGIVGESGSGKSTLARIALALERPDFRRGAPRGPFAVRPAASRIARAARPHADDFSGPLRLARSAPARREDRRRAAGGAGRSGEGGTERARRRVARGRRLAMPPTRRNTRMSSPAVSVSASRLRARSSPGRSWSSPTSRCRRSTSRFRPRR